jgi:hypothetical protein
MLFTVWLGNAVWAPRLHTVVGGTPDLGYRQNRYIYIYEILVYAHQHIRNYEYMLRETNMII